MPTPPLYPSSWGPPKYPEARVSQGLCVLEEQVCKVVGLLEVLRLPGLSGSSVYVMRPPWSRNSWLSISKT